MCAGLVCTQVYVCRVICKPPLGTTRTIPRIVPSVTKGGGVSTGVIIMVTIHWVCVQFTGTESTQLRECLPPMWPRVEESPQVAKVKVVEASQCMGDFPQAW